MLRSSKVLVLLVAFAASSAFVVATAQPPVREGAQKGEEKGAQKGGQRGGRGGQPGQPGRPGGNFTRPKPGTILPSFMADRLKLTDEQKKELEELQKMVDEKLSKLLTDEQKKTLETMGTGRGGPGGTGGAPGRGGRPGTEPPPPPPAN